MSAQSGFLDCFLKFIQGEKGEKLPSMGRGTPLSARFTITMDERNAILAASSKRLSQERKAAEPKSEKQTKKRGKPRVSTCRRSSRSTRSKGSVSEVDSESGGNDTSDSHSNIKERLCSNVDSNDGDESSSGDQKSEEMKCGDETVKAEGQSDDNVGENRKILRDRGKTKKRVESSKKRGPSGNNVSETESTTSEMAESATVKKVESVASEKAESASVEKAESATVEKAESATGEEAESATGEEAETATGEKAEAATDEKTESTTTESAVILNGEASKGKETKEAESVDSAPSPGKKKRGRKRKSDSNEDTPRRKLSSRKAKQKPLISYAESGDEEDIPGLDDNSDSDDPVWVPDEKKGSSDEGSNFSWSKYEKMHSKSRKSGSNTPAQQSRLRDRPHERGMKLSLSEDTVSAKPSSGVKGAGDKSEVLPTVAMPASSSNGVKADVKNVVATVSNVSVKTPPSVAKTDILNPYVIVMPFQSGTFIAQKSELEEKEDPPIWRVDGKSLLQKYEPFRAENGNTCYRNVSTYSGWGPKSHLQYQEIPVKFIKQNRVETIVEIIQAELPINEDKLCEKIMKEYEKHSYAYEVFVQTLVSQALDSNFLSEIIAEKDDYFLNCVEEIDKVCEGKKISLMEAHQWPKKLTESLATWPALTLSQGETILKNQCSVCYSHQDVTLMKMDGNPYKFSTLEYEAPSEESFKSKEFPVCSSCSEILILFHKIVHLKYHTYENGVKLVLEKKALDPSKNNTDVLHDILADGERVKKEFQEISRMWAQAEIKSRRVKPIEDKKVITLK